MAQSTWALDPTHSELQFKVKHLMISTVTGQFNHFNGNVTTESDDFTSAKINFSADVNSISTNNEHRDAHLRNSDFFESDKYPHLSFESDKLDKVDEENFKLHGTLNMHGVSKEVILDAEYGGTTQDPWGNTRAGFTVTGKIDRRDFGMTFGQVSETGGVMLGYDIKISANVQFVKQAEAQPA